jgi:hypothetical protein
MFNGRRQPSRGGTSRMTRECQVRFCERLGVQFPGPTRPQRPTEGHSFPGFAPQEVELVSKNKDFGFQRSPRPEQPGQGAPDQPAKIAHRWNYQPIRERQSAVLGLR